MWLDDNHTISILWLNTDSSVANICLSLNTDYTTEVEGLQVMQTYVNNDMASSHVKHPFPANMNVLSTHGMASLNHRMS